MNDPSKRRVLTLASGLMLTVSAIGIAFQAVFRKRAQSEVAPVQQSTTILKDAAELYDRWLPCMPATMQPFAQLTMASDTRIRWQLEHPMRHAFETNLDRNAPGRTLSWNSTDPNETPFSGSVMFTEAPGNRGTEVALALSTRLPRVLVAPALTTALRRFKSLVEAGELPSLEANPSGRDKLSLKENS